MRKLTLITLLLLTLFVSCKKENGDDDYYFTFTVNGVNKSYSGFIAAATDTSGAYVELTILGATSSTSFDDYLGIYLNNSPSTDNIVPGQYEDLSADFTLLTTYGANGKDYESGQSVAEEAAANGITLTNHFKVNITSMDSKSVKGTFSGDYYDAGNVQTGEKLTITNGSFHVKFMD